MKKKEKHIVIDARGQVLGRLASKVAFLLMNKNQPDYKENQSLPSNIEIINVSSLKFTGKKLVQKKYYHFSGFPGGMKVKKAAELMEENPAQILRWAVYHMLPSNKLRNQRLKRLNIKN